MLVAFASVVGLNCTTPTASFLRTPPSQRRASARSRSLACGPCGGQRRARPTTVRHESQPAAPSAGGQPLCTVIGASNRTPAVDRCAELKD